MEYIFIIKCFSLLNQLFNYIGLKFIIVLKIFYSMTLNYRIMSTRYHSIRSLPTRIFIRVLYLSIFLSVILPSTQIAHDTQFMEGPHVPVNPAGSFTGDLSRSGK